LIDSLLGHSAFASVGLEDSTGSELKHILHLLSTEYFILLAGHTSLLNDQTIPLEFDGLAFNDLLLNCVLSN
jgi:hypothetical protein